MRYRIPAALLAETFDVFRQCGGGQRECQLLWTSPWSEPEGIKAVVHPQHRAHAGGFELASDWVNRFWRDLARTGSGIRVQIHTHPHHAFHSSIDDAFPRVCAQCAGGRRRYPDALGSAKSEAAMAGHRRDQSLGCDGVLP